MGKINKLIKLSLVPVKVFGTDEYGLCDAVSAWSDCNRAEGKIYRVDDIKYSKRDPGESVEIWVNEKDLSFFEKKWGDE